MENEWEAEGTDAFAQWFQKLPIKEQVAVARAVDLLEIYGPALGFPHSSSVRGSRIPLRELRALRGQRPLRVLYVFDPRRTAILLLGGDKSGNARWYREHISRAEALYAEYLGELNREGLLDG